jgi:predicted nucleic acid-binding protein
MPVHPVTVPIALRAGQIDGENQARGTRVPLPDLLSRVTALELGYSVGNGEPSPFPRGCDDFRTFLHDFVAVLPQIDPG